MDELKIIKEALESNPGVVIIDVPETIYPPEKGIIHIVTYYVAPKNGLYTADELQAFMTGLVPGLEPKYKLDFEQTARSIKLGRIYFDEKIGEKKTATTEIISLVHKEPSRIGELVPRQKNYNTIEEYMRRIWIMPTPSETIGRDFIKGKFEFGSWIKLEDIAAYCKAEKSAKKSLSL